MIFVVTVGGQTVRIFADNAAQARERITSRFPGEPVTLVREGDRSGDANFRLISPTSFDPQGNPVYAPVGTPPPDDGGSGGGGVTPPGSEVPALPARPLGTPDPSFSGPGDELQPFAAFTRGLRQAGLPTTGFLGDRFRSRFDPLRSLNTASLVAGTSPLGRDNTDFQQFASQFGGNMAASRQLAADTLRSLFGNTGGGQAGLADPRTSAQQAFANPNVGVRVGNLVGVGDTSGARSDQVDNAEDMFNLFQSALGNQTSGVLARRLAPTFRRNLLRDFEEQVVPTQGEGVSFGDFFRNRAQNFLGPNF